MGISDVASSVFGDEAAVTESNAEGFDRSVAGEALGDFISIRGRRLGLTDLVDKRLFQAENVRSLRERMARARPFPHLVMEDCFRPALLELVQEEFDLVSPDVWQTMRSTLGTTYRSKPRVRLGPATELYFGVVNSAWFTDFLSEVSGVDDLLPDPGLQSGGMHETRTGGRLDVHNDFDRHIRYGFKHELAFITYLNPTWDPSHGGAFELWDCAANRLAVTVPPRFGCSVLMRHGPRAFHGHRTPWSRPDGRPRRSVAAYYYSDYSARDARHRKATVFLYPDSAERLIGTARRVTPPFLWDLLVKRVRR